MLGVILAGGRSSRMGVDKATVEVGGVPMLKAVARALRAVCGEVVVAGGGRELQGLTALPDPGERHRGPLAGLVVGLRQGAGRPVLAVGVDQPWVRAQTVRELASRLDDLAVVPVNGGVRQTTCAVYPASVLTAAETELEGGGSLQSLLDVVAFDPVVESEWATWGEDGRSWFSVDRPSDIEAGLSRFGRLHPG